MSKNRTICEKCGGTAYQCSEGYSGTEYFKDYCCEKCSALTYVKTQKPKRTTK